MYAKKRPLSQRELEEIAEEISDFECPATDNELSTDDDELDYVEQPESEESEVYSENEAGMFVNTIDDSNSQTVVYKSKIDNLEWSSNPVKPSQSRSASKNVIKSTPGPTPFARRMCDTAGAAFLLFFREPLLQEICKWTNKEGSQVLKNNWKNVDIKELKVFIGVLILTGVYKSRNEPVVQLWSKNDGREIFNKAISRNRFQELLRFLRFDDAAARRTNRSNNKLKPIQDCFQIWNGYLRELYNPGWCMTIDEQLVTFRGRCPFRQYIPSKPGRYGIKFWAICDSDTSYVWKMDIYKGKEAGEQRSVKLGETVVKNLVKEIEGSARNITCDNFFTSYSVAEYLLSKKLTIVGTIRRNKPELPTEFTNPAGRKINSSIYGFREEATIVSYCPKKGKLVTLLSTMHNDGKNDKSNEKKKPEIILSYNTTKAGVDTMDQMTRCYTVKRMTRRWPLVVFYNMIDVSVLNCFIIWKSITNSTINRRQFIINLGKELAKVNIDTSAPDQAAAVEDVVEPDVKRRRCSMCPPSLDRKNKILCKKCHKNICNNHSFVICKNCYQ